MYKKSLYIAEYDTGDEITSIWFVADRHSMIDSDYQTRVTLKHIAEAYGIEDIEDSQVQILGVFEVHQDQIDEIVASKEEG